MPHDRLRDERIFLVWLVKLCFVTLILSFFSLRLSSGLKLDAGLLLLVGAVIGAGETIRYLSFQEDYKGYRPTRVFIGLYVRVVTGAVAALAMASILNETDPLNRQFIALATIWMLLFAFSSVVKGVLTHSLLDRATSPYKENFFSNQNQKSPRSASGSRSTSSNKSLISKWILSVKTRVAYAERRTSVNIVDVLVSAALGLGLGLLAAFEAKQSSIVVSTIQHLSQVQLAIAGAMVAAFVPALLEFRKLKRVNGSGSDWTTGITIGICGGGAVWILQSGWSIQDSWNLMWALLASLLACIVALLAYQVISRAHQDKFQELRGELRRAKDLVESVIKVLPIVYRDRSSSNEEDLREWALKLDEARKSQPAALPLYLCLAEIRFKEGDITAAFEVLDTIPENIQSNADVEQLRKKYIAAAALEPLSQRFFVEANFSIEALSDDQYLVNTAESEFPEPRKMVVILKPGKTLEPSDVYGAVRLVEEDLASRLGDHAEKIIWLIGGQPTSEAQQTAHGTAKDIFVGFMNENELSQAIETRQAGARLREKIMSLKGMIDLYESNQPALVGNDFYGRQEIRKRSIRMVEAGRSFALFGMWRMGKTSLLLSLSSALKEHVYSYVDLLEFRDAAANQLLREVVGGLADDIKKKEFVGFLPTPALDWGESDEEAFAAFTSHLAALCDALRKQQRRMVIVIDEADALLSIGAGYGESYTQLCRSFLISLLRRAKRDSVLVPIIAGRSPEVLEQLTPNKGGGGVLLRFMPYLDEAECFDMVTGIGSKMYLTWSPKSLQSIFEETGGQVHMVRCFCSQIVNRFRQSKYDQEHVVTVREDFCRSPNNWIQTIWSRSLSEAEKTVLRKLADQPNWTRAEVYAMISSDSDREILESLKCYGIVHQPEIEKLGVRGNIVRDWISRYGRQ
jgi:hypothetical protein